MPDSVGGKANSTWWKIFSTVCAAVAALFFYTKQLVQKNNDNLLLENHYIKEQKRMADSVYRIKEAYFQAKIEECNAFRISDMKSIETSLQSRIDRFEQGSIERYKNLKDGQKVILKKE